MEIVNENSAWENYRTLTKALHIDHAGDRIDLFLAQKFPFHSRTRWKRLLTRGEVLVNKAPARGSYLLKSQDELLYFSPAASEPSVNKDIKIVWQNAALAVIYKPPNLPMHEGGAYRKNTFSELLKTVVGPEWAAIHRLDRETSGIVLCAKTRELRHELSQAMIAHRIRKTYFAIVNGCPAQDSWITDAPIGAAGETSFRLKQWVTKDGSSAQTKFEVIARKNGRFALLKVQPLTGRTHQIRVHAAWSGLHLVGDKKYHPDESIYLEYLEKGFTERVKHACHYDRLCLHAQKLRFRTPEDPKAHIEIEKSMPADMMTIWRDI